MQPDRTGKVRSSGRRRCCFCVEKGSQVVFKFRFRFGLRQPLSRQAKRAVDLIDILDCELPDVAQAVPDETRCCVRHRLTYTKSTDRKGNRPILGSTLFRQTPGDKIVS